MGGGGHQTLLATNAIDPYHFEKHLFSDPFSHFL